MTNDEILAYIGSYAQAQLNRVLPMRTRVAIVRHYERGSYVIMLASQGENPLLYCHIAPPTPLFCPRVGGGYYTLSWETRYRTTEDGMVGKLEFLFVASRCDLFV